VPERVIELSHVWTLGEPLGDGGFGRVFAASSPEVNVAAAAKLVPKAPGADRELLFVELGSARNVVPFIDRGEDGDDLVIVMQRAEKSLRQHLTEHIKLSESDGLAVLTDIASALEDLAGRVVHRDLKPENVLLVEGRWCLTDFGIARYAEASTAEDTRKFSMTRPYAAPEQWRWERASSAADIYALGVIAYEILAGILPFVGPDFREEHLHTVPPKLEGVSGSVASLVGECLYKGPGSRPSASDLVRRLAGAGRPVPAGLTRLQRAHENVVANRAASQESAARAATARERATTLFEDARSSLALIGNELRGSLIDVAPSIVEGREDDGGWLLELGNAKLHLSAPANHAKVPRMLPFDVIAYATLSLHAPGMHGYQGRSHSLWYCDATIEGSFGWFEMAFMPMALSGRSTTTAPFALNPDEGAPAIGPGVNMVQLAWNLTRLVPGELDEFITRWGDWLASASTGQWAHPTSLPEIQIVPNWRQR
jgi:hypothetical protein